VSSPIIAILPSTAYPPNAHFVGASLLKSLILRSSFDQVHPTSQLMTFPVYHCVIQKNLWQSKNWKWNFIILTLIFLFRQLSAQISPFISVPFDSTNKMIHHYSIFQPHRLPNLNYFPSTIPNSYTIEEMNKKSGRFSFQLRSFQWPSNTIIVSSTIPAQQNFIVPSQNVSIFDLCLTPSTDSLSPATYVNASKEHFPASATSLLNKQKLILGTRSKLIWWVHGLSDTTEVVCFRFSSYLNRSLLRPLWRLPSGKQNLITCRQ